MSVQTAIRPCTTFTTTNLSTLYPGNSLCDCLTKNTTKEAFALIAQKVQEAGFSLSDDGDEHGRSVVHVAAAVNHVIFRTISNEYITDPKLLISRGMKICGWSPLHFAVAYNQIETVYTLISLGSPINLASTNDVSDTYRSVPKGSTPLDLILLSKGGVPITSLLKINGAKQGLLKELDNDRSKSSDSFITRVESAAMDTLESIAKFFSETYHVDFLNKDVFPILVGYLADYESFIKFS